MFKSYQLKPEYERVKSYYGKATVDQFDNHMILYSYGRKMIDYDSRLNTFKVYGPRHSSDICFTRTTNRHMREFLFQCLGCLPYDEIKKHCVGYYSYGKFKDAA